jgi:poly(U)-specific endoribonuclease
MSDTVFEAYYREIFSDLSVSREESEEIKEKLDEVNPPPDKLVWLRASAFRIGCEFLSDDDSESNVSLLKTINGIVHAVETACMLPTVGENEDFDEEQVEELYREVFADLSVDREENEELFDFFRETNRPSNEKLIWVRASAFRIGSEFLSEDGDNNVALLKCINMLVHALEMTCMTPKPYELKVEMPVDVDISEAAQFLWDLDANRLTPNQDYKVNVQGGKKPYWKEDGADDPLFTFVDRSAFRRPTYKAFIALLDNYSAEVGSEEVVSYEERVENYTFLNAIMQTAPMQFCHKYCVANGEDVPEDPKEFIALLNKIWFQMYRRGGDDLDSSGFEHVFIGEIKNEKVSGFHNWIYFYSEERKGNVDYRGYIKPKSYSDAPTNDDDQVLTLQFEWNGVLKNVGTSFIGVSPEFEMALYTMCFLTGEEENTIDLDTGNDVFKLNCKVFTMASDKIGTSFVEALEHED